SCGGSLRERLRIPRQPLLRRRRAMFESVTPAALRTFAAMLGLAAAAGCAVGPDYVEPKNEPPQQFAHADNAAYSPQDAVGEFWTQFGDETLERLVNDALRANHDLRIALARVVEARALRGETRLDLLPQVTAGAGYTEQRLPRSLRIPGQDEEIYDASFDAFWELDFFGRVRRAVEASTAEAQSAEASLRDAQVIVAAEVARVYFELRGQQSQLEVA